VSILFISVIYTHSSIKLESPELDVMCFRLNEYWYPNKQPSPPIVLPFDQILCQITRGVVESSIPPLWITTSLDRVCGFLLDL
jgi:hypothetical protein